MKVLLNKNFRSSILFGLISGFSVFYFLYFLKAYNIQQGDSYSGHSHLFRSFAFGLLTFTFICVSEYKARPQFKINTIGKVVLWYAIEIIIGSQLIFLLFNYFWNWTELNLQSYALIMKEFPLIMIIPIVINHLLTVDKTNLSDNIPTLKTYQFQSTNEKDQLIIKLNDILYIQSSQNYLEINYRINKSMQQHLIRKPMKTMKEELRSYPEFIQCHRSYLVNTNHLAAVVRKRDKVEIRLDDSTVLPVSKQYQTYFLTT